MYAFTVYSIYWYSVAELVVLVYGVVGSKGYIQFTILKSIGNLVYERNVICEGDPFFFGCICVGMTCVLIIILYISLKNL